MNRRRARELAGVPDGLMAVFSQRSADIEAAVDTAVEQHLARTGRQPSTRSLNRMRQHLTLTTRDRKKASSLADATSNWRDTAFVVLGRDPSDWARSLPGRNDLVQLSIADDVTETVIDAVALRVVDAVAGSRSTWTRWNLTAEAMRQVTANGWQFNDTGDTVEVRDRIVAAAEQLSTSLTPAEIAPVPNAFRDPDGASQFARARVFTSRQVLAAEDTLLTLAEDRSGPWVHPDRADRIAAQALPGRGYALSVEDQAPAAVSIARSGRVVDLLIGPAGTGKTTCMAGIRAIWETEYGPGSIVGLAPSAKAAQVLAADLGIVTDNTAQWRSQQTLQPGRAGRLAELDEKRDAAMRVGRSTAELDRAVAAVKAEFDRWRLQPGQLLIVDEAGMAGTFVLADLAEQARIAGAKLLLVGDPCQLSPVETGGAFGLLAARSDPPTLSVVRRFVDPDGTLREWEQRAANGLRLCNESAAHEYATHGRVHAGDRDDMTGSAYTGWLTDTRSGARSLLIAADADTVRDLNERSRADLVVAGTVDNLNTVRLRDGLDAGRGDRIVTREIDRYLSDGSRLDAVRGRRTDGFVRNGQQWVVDRARRDGSLAVRLLDDTGSPSAAAVTLPAAYVRQHVELAYATTVHRAQGMTTDTAHVLADATVTREAFYVAMTRGRHTNQAYLVLDPPQYKHVDHPLVTGAGDSDQLTREEVLHAITSNTGPNTSAHQTIRTEQDRAASISQLASEAETIAAYAHDLAAGDLLLSVLGDTPAVAALLQDNNFGKLVNAMRRAHATGIDLETVVPGLAAPMRARGTLTANGLADAIKLHATATSSRQTNQRLVAGLIPDATTGLHDPELLHAIRERYRLIEQRAQAVLHRDVADGAPWLRALAPVAGREQATTSTALLVAAYRDRWNIGTDDPLGRSPDNTASHAQQADYRRAGAALSDLRRQGILPAQTPALSSQRSHVRDL